MNTEHGESVIERLTRACETQKGMLMLINLDNFQIFKYVYGAELATELIKNVSKALDDNTADYDVKGYVGEDEFVVFSTSIADRVAFKRLYGNMKNKLAEHVKKLVGEDMRISLGVSVGVVMVPEEGTDYRELFQKADMALEHVKQSGIQGCAFYGNQDSLPEEATDKVESISRGLDESSLEKGALWLEYDHFSIVYRFVKRYIQTYKTKAVKVLLTITPLQPLGDDEMAEIIREYGMTVNGALRKSDVMMQSRPNQLFLLLPDMEEQYIAKAYNRIMNRWTKNPYSKMVQVKLEYDTLKAVEE